MSKSKIKKPFKSNKVSKKTTLDSPNPQEVNTLVALFNEGRYTEVVTLAQIMTVRFPLYEFGWKVLGVAFNKMGRNTDALEPMQKAVALSPGDAVAHGNLGVVLFDLGRLDEAEASCRRALQIMPDSADVYFTLGNALQAMRRSEEAEACYRRALQIEPDHALAYNNLGQALQDLVRVDEAEASYRRALLIKPDYNEAYSNLLFCLSHNEKVGATALFAEHCRFGEQFEAPLRAFWPQHSNSREPGRCLQVGFVSGDLRAHPVANFIEPVLAHLAGYPQLALHAYYNDTREDNVTLRLRKHLKYWHSIVGLTDDALAEKIRADGIDILIDLSGHTALNRLLTFARKPAPVQVGWMGYPGTTGLSAMDYFLGDRFLLPPGQFDDQFTEKIVYLPAYAPFLPDADAPPLNGLPALLNGYVTFGSFNRQNKLSPAVIALWSQLLRALPDSRLVLGGTPVDSKCDALIDWFAKEGIVRERLIFHAHCDKANYLALFQQVDICLDTFPFNGGITTLNALWMGVPTLTLAGYAVAGRAGAGILGHVGLDAFVAQDAADFVRKGLSWAGNPSLLASVREHLRERLEQSAMGQTAMVAAGYECALRRMWQRWCDGLPAESFEVSRQPNAENQHSFKEPLPVSAVVVQNINQEKSPSPQEIDTILALYNEGRYTEAANLAQAMTECFPLHEFGWKALGSLLNRMGRNEDALAPMQKAVALSPGDAQAHGNLGVLLCELGRLDEAEASYRRSLEIEADCADVLVSFGNTLNMMGRLGEAEASYRRALEINPDSAAAYANLGSTLLDLGRRNEAETSCRCALEINPDSALAYNNLGNVLYSLGQLDVAVDNYRRAVEIDPNFALAHYNQGVTLMDLGRLDESESSYRRALQIKPDLNKAYTNLLFCLSHNEKVGAAALFAEHCGFGEQFEAPLRAFWPQHSNSREPGRCLQVGFVSGDLRVHPVANFIEPVLAHLADYPQLVLHAYYNDTREDNVTRRLQKHLKYWHSIVGLTDDALAEKIRADGIDILIDLSGHTALNRLLTFARKPAPVQVGWMGYPGTTGLSAMDYFLGDRFLLPPGQFDDQFTEKIVYLPAYAPFLPDADAPPLNALPALRNGYVTFGSFNRHNKISPAVIALWSQLLHALPDSRLVLGGTPVDRKCDALIDWFAKEGIARERLIFHAHCDIANYLALFQQVDICLDTFPFNGGITTLNALWMGVPTLTLAGYAVAGRAGAGILGHVGLDAFVAQDKADFVRKGLSWAGNLSSLANVREHLRERFGQSAMGQTEMVAAGYECALRMMWQRWCDGLPAESFEVSRQPNAENQHAFKVLPPVPAVVAQNIDQEKNPSPQEMDTILALYNEERYTEAAILAQAMTERFPLYGPGWKALGSLLNRMGRNEDALAPMQKAAALLPSDPEAHGNLGIVLYFLCRLDEAEASYRRVLEIAPDLADGHFNLGNTLQVMGRLGEAEVCFRRALQIKPDFVHAHNNLGLALHDLARVDEAEVSYRHALQIEPDYDTAYSNLLFCLSHNEKVGATALFAEHRRFGEQFEAPLKAFRSQHSNSREPGRCLQVGFVSGDLRVHPVANFIEPVLAHLAGYPQLVLHAYYNHNFEDSVTLRLRKHLKYWHSIVDLSDDALAEKIRADGIDILIDLSGHTTKNRLLTFARKPAPVQVGWMGYPGTTGLSAMDYFLADRFLLPPGQFDDQFSEKIVYLPAYAPFLPEVDAPPVNALPALRNGYVTFGSFNRQNKLSPAIIALWSQLLRALPDSRMVLGGMQGDGKYDAQIDWFAKEGIERERLSFHTRCGMANYLALHQQVDICLDTFPFNGGITTLNALWMGVPILTLAGYAVAGRAGAGILGHVGLDAFVAQDAADFVRKGLYWAGNPSSLASVREHLRERLEQSAMGQTAMVAAGYECALRRMWQRWCDGLPAESFEVSRQPNAENQYAFKVLPPVSAVVLQNSKKKPKTKPAKQNKSVEKSALHQKKNPSPQEIDTVLALYNEGRYTEAAALAQAMTVRFPLHEFGWKVLGVMFNKMGRNADALAPMQKAVALSPNDAQAHGNLGVLLCELGRLDEAEASYRRALEIEVDCADVLFSLGNTLNMMGRLEEAEASYRRVLEIKPDYAGAHANLGSTLLDLGRRNEAEASCLRALEIKPDFALAYGNLGNVLYSLGQLDAAEDSYRRAVEIEPDFALAHYNQGITLTDLGRLGESESSYRRSLQIKPDYARAHSGLIFCVSRNEKVGVKAMLAECSRYAEQFEAPLSASWPQHGNTREPERCLQVGFVSGDLYQQHPVVSFIEPVLAHLADYPQLALHVYYNHTIEDNVTQRLRKHLTHWHSIVGLSDDALAEKIRADGIDILIDLSGHTARNRLLTFARKPAPVQASWIGYPCTTGLSSMDYYLADRFLLPPGQFDDQFTEKIVHLPAFAPFLPAEDAPPVNALPALSNGFMTFGSFNHVSKLNQPVIALWAQLLRALPDSRMVLGGMPVAGKYDVLIDWFAKEGIKRERLSFHTRCDMASYLALHQQVDICLDAFPYNGGTTTINALWMGVPTLTLAGHTLADRVGAGILGHVGLDAFVAQDAADFVQKGLHWANHLSLLASVRTQLRGSFGQSALGQPEVVAAGVACALRMMWQRWCDGLPAESFEVSGQVFDKIQDNAIDQ